MTGIFMYRLPGLKTFITITLSLALWVECSPMVRETWVQSQVTSYQWLLKWYLIPPCLTLSNIRYVSRVKWSNSRKGLAPSPTPRCSSYWKGSLLVTLDNSRQLYFFFTYFIWDEELLLFTGIGKQDSFICYHYEEIKSATRVTEKLTLYHVLFIAEGLGKYIFGLVSSSCLWCCSSCTL